MFGLHPTGGFFGGAFDGRHVYFVSSGDATTNNVTRYNTQGAFTENSSCGAFNLSSINHQTFSFAGAAFDGRYAYFVPGANVLLRYDAEADFATAASWSAFELSALDPRAGGFAGAVFDGRCTRHAAPSAP